MLDLGYGCIEEGREEAWTGSGGEVLLVVYCQREDVSPSSVEGTI